MHTCEFTFFHLHYMICTIFQTEEALPALFVPFTVQSVQSLCNVLRVTAASIDMVSSLVPTILMCSILHWVVYTNYLHNTSNAS